VAAVLVLSLIAPARADDASRFALVLGGEAYGLVRASETPRRAASEAHQLVLEAEDVTTPLVSLVTAFAGGKPVKRDLRLSSGAVMRKADDARLVSVKLPALGSGGIADVTLGFAATAVTTQPLLSPAKASAPRPGARITSFRVDLAEMKAIEAPKLDAITITQRPDGSASTSDVTFETAAGGAPPFTAWQRTNGGRPAPRPTRVEYVAADGAAILALMFDRCTPTSVRPMGASGTTRITLTCAGVRARAP
jgi:hypothetical protein